MKSTRLHDDDSAYRKALGDDFAKMSREFAANGLLSTESNMFSINPGMSYVSEDVAKVAPAFWNPKTAPGKGKLTATKKTTKETASRPITNKVDRWAPYERRNWSHVGTGALARSSERSSTLSAHSPSADVHHPNLLCSPPCSPRCLLSMLLSPLLTASAKDKEKVPQARSHPSR